MFEPERTPAEVQNLLKELEIKQNSPQDDCPPRNTRIENMDWCACSKTCEAMMIKQGVYAAKKEMTDELFKGINFALSISADVNYSWLRRYILDPRNILDGFLCNIS